jgi:hypothetical protein
MSAPLSRMMVERIDDVAEALGHLRPLPSSAKPWVSTAS